MKPIPFMSELDKARFWSYVIKKAEDECWLWSGPTDNEKYGRFTFNSISYNANRIAYYLAYEIDPAELDALHNCDNPPCCNPEHLFLGTKSDNAQDRENKGRGQQVDGEFNPSAKLTWEIVRKIRFESFMGAKGMDLAIKYNVSDATISDIINYKAWIE